MSRTVKSFVLRAGRISPRQQVGLEHYLSHYTMPALDHVWDLESAFGRQADTIVEIGFGMGASLLAMAQARPDINFLGIEVHRAGIGALAVNLYEQQIMNVRIAPYDAVEVFKACIADESLTGIQIFFPDPWPKKRHHKRRLVQSAFIQDIVKKIKVGGFIHCATDWQDYAEHMLEVLTSILGLRNQQLEGSYVPRPNLRPITKFEQRGTSLGHDIWDLIFVREMLL